MLVILQGSINGAEPWYVTKIAKQVVYCPSNICVKGSQVFCRQRVGSELKNVRKLETYVVRGLGERLSEIRLKIMPCLRTRYVKTS